MDEPGFLALAEVERIAAEQSCSQIELDYWCENEDAAIFYKKLGFAVAREVTWKPL
ncbi:hypothetical protein [Planomicrobium sp. YIM 101495]|uniref:hypothetical protein n=1 Tax=Planomicrobium sp. YIM 101495 TaxID=2665160 RepID=UPI0018A97B14|nr:hypothetical protein [Planomicrobium sp. YIM 101495]